MRVLFVSRGYTTHDRRFLGTISDGGHEALFLRLEPDHVHDTRELPAGVREIEWDVETVSRPADARAAVSAFEHVVETYLPDLVQAGPIPTGAYLAALAGARPLVAMSWGSDVLVDAARDDEWRAASAYAVQHADLLVCDSVVVEDRLLELARPSRPDVLRFPWGIDVGAFMPGPTTLPLRSRDGWRDATVVLSTRSWEPLYGTLTLIDAFRRARQRVPRLKLMLLGGGSLSSEVDTYIGAHGLGDAVERCGLVRYESLPDIFRAADVYLSCSLTDGTSISLLEALATGIPAVVSDIPGNREWVQPGENGWLAPPGDAAAFADALVAAATLPEDLRSRMAAANRKVAMERADWAASAKRMLDAYRDLERRLPARRA